MQDAQTSQVDGYGGMKVLLYSLMFAFFLSRNFHFFILCHPMTMMTMLMIMIMLTMLTMIMVMIMHNNSCIEEAFHVSTNTGAC